MSILLSESSQSKKAISCMTLIIRQSGKGETMDTIKISVVVVRGWFGGEVRRETIGRAWRIFTAVELL